LWISSDYHKFAVDVHVGTRGIEWTHNPPPLQAGDIVPKKKPDPAIYMLAAKELGVNPQNCCVIEDSRIGLQAAKAAGMVCLVTKSSYTQDEDFR